MAQPLTIVLNAGGLRSLVATTAVVSEAEQRVHLLHVLDEHGTSQQRLEAIRQQARHFNLDHTTIGAAPATGEPPPPHQPPPPLRSSRMLLAGLAHAATMKARRLVWPVQSGEHERIAAATEQLVLLEHLAQLEGIAATSIEAPLLELTDLQVLELGSQLGVPWELAWTCQAQSPRPCQTCPGCTWRQTAFDEAGLTDPIRAVGSIK